MPIRHCGTVEVFYRLVQHFTGDAVHKVGSNVVSFQLATGERQCNIVECYLAPNVTSIIESVIADLKEQPRGAKLMVAG